MSSTSLVLEKISLGFHGEALFSDFSVELESGSCTCLLGPSGCGKSTLLGIIADNPAIQYSGRVVYEGEVVSAGMVGWMAQSDLLLPWLKVIDNVLLGARLRGEHLAMLQQKAHMLLEQAGLGDYSDSLPAELSGGMRQRVALLRTLMEQRPLLLMDEPFSALDALTRLKLQDLAAELTRKRTVVMVTHDPIEALRLSDRVLILGNRPLEVRKSFRLEGKTPRDPHSPEIQAVYRDVLDLLLDDRVAP